MLGEHSSLELKLPRVAGGGGAFRAVRRVPKHFDAATNLVFSISIVIRMARTSLEPGEQPVLGAKGVETPGGYSIFL